MNRSINRISRIEREKKTIKAMLDIYCQDKHAQGCSKGLCENCHQLKLYAFQRLDVCPFQENKPACNHCQVHCYAKAKRDQIKQVMRFAGPKMMLRHPVLSFHHLIDSFRKEKTLDDI